MRTESWLNIEPSWMRRQLLRDQTLRFLDLGNPNHFERIWNEDSIQLAARMVSVLVWSF